MARSTEMTPAEFHEHLRGLLAERDWQGVVDWCDQHYDTVKPQMSDEDQDAVERGALPVAYMVLEGRRRHALAEQEAEGELARAA
jgi:hypothetical protein